MPYHFPSVHFNSSSPPPRGAAVVVLLLLLTAALVTHRLSARASAGPEDLSYSTYLGGRGDDLVYAIAVDARGAVYAAGETKSADFPTSQGAFDTS